MTPMEAIKAGTINAAHLMMMQDSISSLDRETRRCRCSQRQPIGGYRMSHLNEHVKLVIKNDNSRRIPYKQSPTATCHNGKGGFFLTKALILMSFSGNR